MEDTKTKIDLVATNPIISNMKITIEDYPILVDMVMNTDFERINESLVVYRVHDKSFSHEKVFKKQTQ